jgi:hypothetical protein
MHTKRKDELEPTVMTTRVVLTILVAAVAGWMVFDASHAFVTGDYVTPRTGEYAGRLGPWASLLERVGIDPRSTPVKVGFLVYGLVYLALLAAFLFDRRYAWHGLVACALVGLLYLIAGTILNVVVLVILARKSMRARS